MITNPDQPTDESVDNDERRDADLDLVASLTSDSESNRVVDDVERGAGSFPSWDDDIDELLRELIPGGETSGSSHSLGRDSGAGNRPGRGAREISQRLDGAGRSWPIRTTILSLLIFVPIEFLIWFGIPGPFVQIWNVWVSGAPGWLGLTMTGDPLLDGPYRLPMSLVFILPALLLVLAEQIHIHTEAKRGNR